MTRGLWAALLRWCAFLAVLSFTACHDASEDTNMGSWVRRPVRYAKHFQLWEKGKERLLITFGPGGEQDTTGTFHLSFNGTFSTDHPEAIRLAVPLDRVALMSTTHASFIAALGALDAVAGVAHAERLLEPDLAARRDSGRLMEIGSADGIDGERLLALGPQLLFTYPYGQEGKEGTYRSTPALQVGEYLEEDPLGRAEWLSVFGTLFNKEALADSLFQGIVSRYGQVRAQVRTDEPGPYVFFGSSWRGKWSVPSGNSYMARTIKDAGGRYLFADSIASGNIDIDLETVLMAGVKADLWGRVMYLDRQVKASDVADDDPRIMALPVIEGHHCFFANSAKSDLFGRATLEPDVVLADLFSIFHPRQGAGRTLVYYHLVQ